MNAGHLPAHPLQAALDPRGLLLVEDEDEYPVLTVLVVLLEELLQPLLPGPVLQHLNYLGDPGPRREVVTADRHLYARLNILHDQTNVYKRKSELLGKPSLKTHLHNLF